MKKIYGNGIVGILAMDLMSGVCSTDKQEPISFIDCVVADNDNKRYD